MADKVTCQYFYPEKFLLCWHYGTFINQKLRIYETFKEKRVVDNEFQHWYDSPIRTKCGCQVSYLILSKIKQIN